MKQAPFLHIVILFAFLANTFGPLPLARAQEFHLPAPGTMVALSPAFNPPILKGLKVHPDNPFGFDFILDKGDSNAIPAQAGIQKLIKYFLASLTIPEKDLWVNLSPYEKNRIVPEAFGKTEMGRDLLAEDYMLKQITASLIYPEGETGRKFWKHVYIEAAQRFGTTNVTVNTFNKVWIVPEKAVVYENAKAGTAYVVEAKLKVMLEQDYLSLQKHRMAAGDAKQSSSIGNQVIREIVIPELTKEVNEGKNFSQLRQVYNSLILATWYKQKIKDGILERVYADRNKVTGVGYGRGIDVESIYQRYLAAFKKGVYNYIKEDIDPATRQPVPRKYFSGGVNETRLDLAMTVVHDAFLVPLQTDSDILIRTQVASADKSGRPVDDPLRRKTAELALLLEEHKFTSMPLEDSTQRMLRLEVDPLFMPHIFWNHRPFKAAVYPFSSNIASSRRQVLNGFAELEELYKIEPQDFMVPPQGTIGQITFDIIMGPGHQPALLFEENQASLGFRSMATKDKKSYLHWTHAAQEHIMTLARRIGISKAYALTAEFMRAQYPYIDKRNNYNSWLSYELPYVHQPYWRAAEIDLPRISDYKMGPGRYAVWEYVPRHDAQLAVRTDEAMLAFQTERDFLDRFRVPADSQTLIMWTPQESINSERKAARETLRTILSMRQWMDTHGFQETSLLIWQIDRLGRMYPKMTDLIKENLGLKDGLIVNGHFDPEKAASARYLYYNGRVSSRLAGPESDKAIKRVEQLQQTALNPFVIVIDNSSRGALSAAQRFILARLKWNETTKLSQLGKDNRHLIVNSNIFSRNGTVPLASKMDNRPAFLDAPDPRNAVRIGSLMTGRKTAVGEIVQKAHDDDTDRMFLDLLRDNPDLKSALVANPAMNTTLTPAQVKDKKIFIVPSPAVMAQEGAAPMAAFYDGYKGLLQGMYERIAGKLGEGFTVDQLLFDQGKYNANRKNIVIQGIAYALYVYGQYLVWKQEAQDRSPPDFVTGSSTGLLIAMVMAGSLTIDELVDFFKAGAPLMAKKIREVPYGVVLIPYRTPQQLAGVIGEGMAVFGYNERVSIAVKGSQETVNEKADELSRRLEIPRENIQVSYPPVPGLHHPFFGQAFSDELGLLVEKIKFKNPLIPIIDSSNPNTPAITTAQGAREAFKNDLLGTVYWAQTKALLNEAGEQLAISADPDSWVRVQQDIDRMRTEIDLNVPEENLIGQTVVLKLQQYGPDARMVIRRFMNRRMADGGLQRAVILGPPGQEQITSEKVMSRAELSRKYYLRNEFRVKNYYVFGYMLRKFVDNSNVQSDEKGYFDGSGTPRDISILRGICDNFGIDGDDRVALVQQWKRDHHIKDEDNLGSLIMNKRIDRMLEQFELVKELKMGKTTIWKAENNEPIKEENLRKIAAFLGLEGDERFERLYAEFKEHRVITDYAQRAVVPAMGIEEDLANTTGLNVSKNIGFSSQVDDRPLFIDRNSDGKVEKIGYHMRTLPSQEVGKLVESPLVDAASSKIRFLPGWQSMKKNFEQLAVEIQSASPQGQPLTVRELSYLSPVIRSPFPSATTVYARYFLPKTDHARKLPVVVINSFFYNDRFTRLLSTYLVSQGVAVLEVGLPLYGKRAIPGTEDMKPADRYRAWDIDPHRLKSFILQAVADTVVAVHWLAARPEIDSDRISLSGQSLAGAIAMSTYFLQPGVANVFATVPLVNYSHLFWSQGKAYEPVRQLLQSKGFDEDGFNESMQGYNLDQLAGRPKPVHPEHIFIAAVKNDQLVPWPDIQTLTAGLNQKNTLKKGYGIPMWKPHFFGSLVLAISLGYFQQIRDVAAEPDRAMLTNHSRPSRRSVLFVARHAAAAAVAAGIIAPVAPYIAQWIRDSRDAQRNPGRRDYLTASRIGVGQDAAKFIGNLTVDPAVAQLHSSFGLLGWTQDKKEMVLRVLSWLQNLKSGHSADRMRSVFKLNGLEVSFYMKDPPHIVENRAEGDLRLNTKGISLSITFDKNIVAFDKMDMLIGELISVFSEAYYRQPFLFERNLYLGPDREQVMQDEITTITGILRDGALSKEDYPHLYNALFARLGQLRLEKANLDDAMASPEQRALKAVLSQVGSLKPIYATVRISKSNRESQMKVKFYRSRFSLIPFVQLTIEVKGNQITSFRIWKTEANSAWITAHNRDLFLSMLWWFRSSFPHIQGLTFPLDKPNSRKFFADVGRELIGKNVIGEENYSMGLHGDITYLRIILSDINTEKLASLLSVNNAQAADRAMTWSQRVLNGAKIGSWIEFDVIGEPGRHLGVVKNFDDYRVTITTKGKDRVFFGLISNVEVSHAYHVSVDGDDVIFGEMRIPSKNRVTAILVALVNIVAMSRSSGKTDAFIDAADADIAFAIEQERNRNKDLSPFKITPSAIHKGAQVITMRTEGEVIAWLDHLKEYILDSAQSVVAARGDRAMMIGPSDEVEDLLEKLYTEYPNSQIGLDGFLKLLPEKVNEDFYRTMADDVREQISNVEKGLIRFQRKLPKPFHQEQWRISPDMERLLKEDYWTNLEKYFNSLRPSDRAMMGSGAAMPVMPLVTIGDKPRQYRLNDVQGVLEELQGFAQAADDLRQRNPEGPLTEGQYAFTLTSWNPTVNSIWRALFQETAGLITRDKSNTVRYYIAFNQVQRLQIWLAMRDRELQWETPLEGAVLKRIVSKKNVPLLSLIDIRKENFEFRSPVKVFYQNEGGDDLLVATGYFMSVDENSLTVTLGKANWSTIFFKERSFPRFVGMQGIQKAGVSTKVDIIKTYGLPLDEIVSRISNSAMVSRQGGIDLTSANMHLQTKGNEGGGIEFHMDPAQLAQWQNAPGVVPIIISIEPLRDLRRFLGASQNLGP